MPRVVDEGLLIRRREVINEEYYETFRKTADHH